MQSMYNDSHKKIYYLQLRLDVCEREKRAAEQKANDSEARHLSIRNECNRLENELRQARANACGQRAFASYLESTLTQTKKLLDEKQRDSVTLQGKCLRLEAEIRNVKSNADIAQLKKENQSLTASLNDAKKQIHALTQRFDWLNDKYKKSLKSLDESRNELEIAKRSIPPPKIQPSSKQQTDTAELKQLLADNKTLKARLDAAEKTNQLMEQRGVADNSELAKLLDDNKTLQSRLDAAEKTNRTLKNQLAVAASECNRLKAVKYPAGNIVMENHAPAEGASIDDVFDGLDVQGLGYIINSGKLFVFGLDKALRQLHCAASGLFAVSISLMRWVPIYVGSSDALRNRVGAYLFTSDRGPKFSLDTCSEDSVTLKDVVSQKIFLLHGDVKVTFLQTNASSESQRERHEKSREREREILSKYNFILNKINNGGYRAAGFLLPLGEEKGGRQSAELLDAGTILNSGDVRDLELVLDGQVARNGDLAALRRQMPDGAGVYIISTRFCFGRPIYLGLAKRQLDTGFAKHVFRDPALLSNQIGPVLNSQTAADEDELDAKMRHVLQKLMNLKCSLLCWLKTCESSAQAEQEYAKCLKKWDFLMNYHDNGGIRPESFLTSLPPTVSAS